MSSTALSNVIAATDATFAQEVEHHQGLTLVEFWATWCGPCRAISPILDTLSVERAGTVKIVKVDTDANLHTTARFGVRSAPTLLIFKDGVPVNKILGAVPKQKIEAALDQYV